ncbi:MAG: twin-arginine translocase TatA/TatE family subunit [Nitrospiraceae bacterium]|nr:MAG: twin-arginine translocase TatA/TatE family subunit [Nitrospiraceae bacterium]
MFGLGATELIIILVIVLVLFGGSKLPEIGRGIGEAIRNFKKSTSDNPEIDVTPKDKTKDQGTNRESKS